VQRPKTKNLLNSSSGEDERVQQIWKDEHNAAITALTCIDTPPLQDELPTDTNDSMFVDENFRNDSEQSSSIVIANANGIITILS